MREVAPPVPASGPDAPSLSAVYEYGPAAELLLPAPAASAAVLAPAAADGQPAAAEPAPRGAAAETCYDIFNAAVLARPAEPIWWSRPAAGAPFEPTTHAEAGERAAALAAALASLGAKRGDRVGVLGPNCPEWMLAMQVRGVPWGGKGGALVGVAIWSLACCSSFPLAPPTHPPDQPNENGSFRRNPCVH